MKSCLQMILKKNIVRFNNMGIHALLPEEIEQLIYINKGYGING